MKEIRKAIVIFVLFAALLAAIYPAVVTGIAMLAFPGQSGGSLVYRGGAAVGSSLIGQPFTSPKYFWPRPSATGGMPYDPRASGGSNLGPTNPVLLGQIGDRVKTLRDAGVSGDIPPDLVTASASGLDPDITVEAALAQVPRVAAARGMTPDQVRAVIADHQQGRTLGFLGADRVNVLELNLALDNS